VRRVRATLVACAALAVALAPWSPASAETDLGILAAVLAGTHVGSDNPQPDSGVAAGALLELTQRWNRFRIHLEGIPEVRVDGNSTGNYGRSSASLSILNATASLALDPKQTFRAGFGFQLVNESNFNGVNGNLDQSRVTSPRFEGVARLPAAHRHFVELTFADMPRIGGVLHIFDQDLQAATPKPELGAEVDYAAAYGWRNAHGSEVLLGYRGLSYHTRNTDNGELVDRNVGGGVTLEVRLPVAK